MNIKVKAIVIEYLGANGYDGLQNKDGECACLSEDLAPCDELSTECTAGYKHPGDGLCGFYIREES